MKSSKKILVLLFATLLATFGIIQAVSAATQKPVAAPSSSAATASPDADRVGWTQHSALKPTPKPSATKAKPKPKAQPKRTAKAVPAAPAPAPAPAPAAPAAAPVAPVAAPVAAPAPAPQPVPAAAPASNEKIVTTAYTTGYTWFDNTPAGSSAIAYPVLHKTAGGTGTYADPLTIAVGHSIINGKDIPDYPAGTRMYIPDVRRYFIVEDSCGDGPTPQDGSCHQGVNADGSGSTIWLDLWLGGQSATADTAAACAGTVTDGSSKLHTVVFNPAPNYVVAPGSGVLHDGKCDAAYGNTLVRN
ncbi:hypothetical protein KIH31_12330 [Paenarthrobacter sp. DKR-5]|uniref:hypothetical protein n=1 Tax=Paenarthrobacter sp. DKR-5 TaxID=2835535 RepID=UPI001BDD2568|nr:hypothetical protein [Paenarthrobacter sp. DKR-5]MBT1003390.1 hypothetical protein [Paenarthrobacter sp. DKR-5]